MCAEPPAKINGVEVPYSTETAELVQQLDSRPPTCWLAYVALGHRPGAASFTALMDASASEDWAHRRAATEQLGHHELGRDAIPQLVTLLSDHSRFVVYAACQGLARLKASAAMDAVLALLRSPDCEMRREALRAFTCVPEAKWFEPILDVFRTDKDSEVHKSAGWCLRGLASSANWLLLFDLWAVDALSRHRLWACELALEYGAVARREMLERLAHDKDGHVRPSAMRALQSLDPLREQRGRFHAGGKLFWSDSRTEAIPCSFDVRRAVVGQS